MKYRILTALSALAVTVVAAVPAAVAFEDVGGGRGIDNREAQLQRMIVHGARSGSLTKSEAFQLQRRLFNIVNLEDFYRHSGHGLSRSERDVLHGKLNHLAVAIERNLNDSERRIGGRRGGEVF